MFVCNSRTSSAMADDEDSDMSGEGEGKVKQESKEANVTSEKSEKSELEEAKVLKQDPGEATMDCEDEKKQDDESVDDEDGSPKKKAKKPYKSKELDIGISEYLGNHTGFFGIIKQRYSDFIVNEVASSGDIVQLTDESEPPVPETVTEMPDEFPPELTPEVLAQLDDLVGIPRPARISATPPTKESKQEVNEVLINVNGVSKDGRKRIHHAVKAKYQTINSFLQEKEDGDKFIVIQRQKGGGTVVIPKRNSWPKGQQYTTFVLYKENMDTMEAISHLSRGTKVKPNMFTYAGTKDRRGKTSQLVSVSKVPPKRLTCAVRQLPLRLGNFRYLPTPQKLGQLRGNKFHIVLREVKDDDDVIMSSIESLNSNGFINYFGSQRFGTTQVTTHSIGLELLKCNWEKAVNLILAPRSSEDLVLNKCRRVWKETGSAEEALSVLKGEYNGSIEGKLLTGLKDRQRNDLVGALGMIPRNTRILYLHAYQSYIWNKIVTRRIQKYGLKVLPGDIVRRKGSENLKEEDLDQEDAEEENEDGNSQSSPTDTADTKKINGNPLSGIDMSNFHVLTEEEAETTHISDVLLPLPGYRIEFPHNEIKEWYVELLAEDDITIADLNNNVKCYSVIGSYRRLVVRPQVTGSITYYDDPTKPLVQSDLDKLQSISVDENRLKEGKHKAVLIEMTLPLSTYATMALRELLKMDTSSQFQATLNTKEHMANLDPDQNAESHRDGHMNNHRDRGHRGDFRGRGHRGDFRGRGHRGDFRGRGNRGHHFRGRGDRGHGFRSRGRGEKRGWWGNHRGGKRGRYEDL